MQIHPLVCTAFNADFDGDQMAKPRGGHVIIRGPQVWTAANRPSVVAPVELLPRPTCSSRPGFVPPSLPTNAPGTNHERVHLFLREAGEARRRLRK